MILALLLIAGLQLSAAPAHAAGPDEIDSKYLSVGGASFLGQPVGGTVCGLVGSGCFRGYQNGAIYWSAGSGAHFIRGAISDRWGQLRWEAGRLGYPTSDEFCGLRDGGCGQAFQGGMIYWSPTTGAHPVWGAILSSYGQAKWEGGNLRYPTSGEFCGLRDGGCGQIFQGGMIYWSAKTGAHPVWGAILDKYASLKWESGQLSFPIGGERCSSRGCTQQFSGGVVAWSPNGGAHPVWGAIGERWAALGRQDGLLGFPRSDEFCGLRDSGCGQSFDRGLIYWSPKSGAWPVHGEILKDYARTGWENGPLGYPTSNEYNQGGRYILQRFQYGTSSAFADNGTVERFFPGVDRLTAGRELKAGQSLLSGDGRFSAVMQADGNFVVYERGIRSLWGSGTAGTGANRIVMQTDGNLVVYAPSGAKWATGTAPASDASLGMQTDGNLVLRSRGGLPLWTSFGGRGPFSQQAVGTGGTMFAGESLWSPGLNFEARMQRDGNFVVYSAGGSAVWSSGTAGSDARRIAVQTDGNAVLYSDSGAARWSTNTAPASEATLVMQDDGNLVLYTSGGPRWSSKEGRLGGGHDAEVDAFVAKYQGHYWDYDGAYGAQCVDLFNFYNRDVVKAPFVGGVGIAANLWDRATGSYDRIPASQNPRKGDVAVWNTSLPFSGGAGHVAIVLENVDGSTIRVIEQNAYPNTITSVRNESKNHLLGYLRPKGW
ncbi:CHAP domain-containing protein [Enemella dayhoffiae]|uniref:CHAP domain-containing protein n=1 Tax=Enemella dayhoffiae TaxID=2016507 RepID=UPI00159562CE|nr:CHAP domain-containing protein [Enemella dayhoffiae]